MYVYGIGMEDNPQNIEERDLHNICVKKNMGLIFTKEEDV